MGGAGDAMELGSAAVWPVEVPGIGGGAEGHREEAAGGADWPAGAADVGGAPALPLRTGPVGGGPTAGVSTMVSTRSFRLILLIIEPQILLLPVEALPSLRCPVVVAVVLLVVFLAVTLSKLQYYSIIIR